MTITPVLRRTVDIVIALLFAALVVACVRSDPTSAQSSYLNAVKRRNDVLVQIQADPQPTWAELRTLAGEMATAEADEAKQLEATQWPDEARPAMSELIDEIHHSIPYWQKAAQGQSEQDVEANINTALVYCGGPAARKVRTALGLPLA